MKYVSAKEAKKFFDISGQTLKLWKDKGLINILFLQKDEI